MANKISVPRGTSDILPSDIALWQNIEEKARQILTDYNYKEIRTPIYEETGLFKRSLGQSSEVVNKQLLELASRKDKEETLSLRPEGTASIVRSYIEQRYDKKESLSKLCYLGPMFRGERPQRGRLRQFHQIGVEAIGPNSASPYLDAEVIALAVNILEGLGITGLSLKINTLGSNEDRANFAKSLREQLKDHVSELSEELQKSFDENVFRILDSKDRTAQSIVSKLKLDHSYLSQESQDYFNQVKSALDSLGVTYEESLNLVRGLDYYTHTVFEISHPGLGSQDAIGAGGRYNGLVAQLGGPETDAVGFALGVERMILAMPQDILRESRTLDMFIIALDENYLGDAFKMLQDLRSQNIAADMSYQVSSMKSLMRTANKSGAQYVMILGEEEIKSQEATIKHMESGSQEKVSFNKLQEFIKNFN